jgi:hypothetical protein
VQFVRRPNMDRYVMVMADVDRLDAGWQQDPNGYLPTETAGPSEVTGRRQDFKNFLAKGKPVEPSVIHVDKNGVTFRDGRHRFAVLRDAGVKQVPVMIERGQANAFSARYAPGAKPPAIKVKSTPPPPVPRIDPDAAQPDTTTLPKEQTVNTLEQLQIAVGRYSKSGITSLLDVRKHMDKVGVSRKDQDRAIQELRRAGVLSAIPDDGRFRYSPEMQAAALVVGDERFDYLAFKGKR